MTRRTASGRCAMALALGAMLAGCVSTLPHWSYGPYPVRPATLDIIAAVLTEHRIEPQIDRVHGVVRGVVPRCGRRAPSVVVQVYREGWVDLALEDVVAGGCFEAVGDQYRTRALAKIYTRLAVALATALDMESP